MQQTDAMKH